MKRFEAVVLAIDMTNNALIPCQVMLLGHLLLHSLVRLHCLLIRLLRTASSAHALHCAHCFICSCTCYGGYCFNLNMIALCLLACLLTPRQLHSGLKLNEIISIRLVKKAPNANDFLMCHDEKFIFRGHLKVRATSVLRGRSAFIKHPAHTLERLS